MRTLRILLWKELLLMKRNPLIPRIILLMPLMVMLVLPLVANMDVKNVNVVVVDNDRSELSRRIIMDIDAAESLTIDRVCTTPSEAMSRIEGGGADVMVQIPADYSLNPTGSQLAVSANGVNATKGALGAQYASRSVVLTLKSWVAENGIGDIPAEGSVINLYNETLDFRIYMLPALMVVLIIMICGFLPALNLVSEKEVGTIEAMNVTPVGRLTFVLSKLIPYWIVGIIVLTVCMLIAWAVYGLKPLGSVWAIYAASILFSLVMSGLGVTIANGSSTMMQSIFVMFACVMVFQLMSGLFTPISSMPQWAQTVTYFLPPRYFIDIMRAVYLKGTPIADLWFQFSALGVMAVALSATAAVTYRKMN